ncbi:GCN5-like N-acetyltransferase, partial [Striga asiatica]
MSSSRTAKAESNKKYAALIQQFHTLEKDWNSFKNNSRPRINHPQSPKSDPTTTTSALTYSHHLSPPTGLIKSPPERSWAVREILRDRRAAFASGRLKGRKLFGDEPEIDWSEFDWMTCTFPVEKVVVVEEERVVGRGRGGYVATMAWFAFVLILVTVGLVMMGCSGKFVGGPKEFGLGQEELPYLNSFLTKVESVLRKSLTTI